MESSGTTTTWGTSLPVPCVQEMAKQHVPDRYIRPDRDESAVSEPGSEIPVIDMQKLLEDCDELARLHSACKDWGFFQLVNHGVSSSLMDKQKKEIEDLFNLPMEEKKKFWQTSEDIEGFGQAFVVSDEQKLDWADMFFITTLPISMRKPHLFPNLPLPFRESLDSYSKELENLANNIIAQFSKALNIKGNEMRQVFEAGTLTMRMNYYPPCPEPDKVIGLCPHSDGAALTILLQVNEVEGLQIKRDGKWIRVMPLPNAFVVNIGQILEIITNGIYKSIEHRATVNSKKERISVAAFYDPNSEVEFGPSLSLITEETPPLFKRTTLQEYKRGFISRQLNGKSYLSVLSTEHNKV